VKTQAPRLWLAGLLNTGCITADAMVVRLLMIVCVSLAMNGCLMLSHSKCRVDVGDRYEANSRETSLDDLVCSRSEQ